MAMKTGPLRRAVGTVGLAALIPTAFMLAAGLITPADAALRAGATLAVVVVVGRLATWWLSSTAASFERSSVDEAHARSQPGPPGGVERRRSPT